MNLAELFLQRDLAKDERAIGDWASKEQSASSIGGSIGGLIGAYGLPALLATIGSGGLLAGPALLAATSIGSSLGNLAGSAIGRSRVDNPDTKFLKGSLLDTENTIADKQGSSALMSGVTSAATGLGKGIEAGGALQKDIYKPLDWLKEQVGKEKLYDMSASLNQGMKLQHTAGGVPELIKKGEYTGLEKHIAGDDRLLGFGKWGIRGNEKLVSDLDKLYRPGAYFGWSPESLKGTDFYDRFLAGKPLEKQQSLVNQYFLQGDKSGMDFSGNAIDNQVLWGPSGSNFRKPEFASNIVPVQGQKIDTLSDYWDRAGWQNLPQTTDMDAVLQQLGIGGGANSMLNVLIQQMLQQQQGTK